MNIYSYIYELTSKTEEWLLPCFHISPEEVMAFAVHLHHELPQNYEIVSLNNENCPP